MPEEQVRHGRPSALSEGDPLRLTGRHFPKYVPASAKINAQRVCIVCSSQTKNGKKVRKETRYQCVEWMGGLMNGWVGGWMDGWVGGWMGGGGGVMDGGMDGWREGWVDGGVGK